MNQQQEQFKQQLQDYIRHPSVIHITHFIIDIQIYVDNARISLTVPKNKSWEEIKNRIDRQLSRMPQPGNICPLCPPCTSLSTPCTSYVSCTQCAKSWCNPCYIKRLKKNIEEDSTLTCPFCHFVFTGEIPTFIIEK